MSFDEGDVEIILDGKKYVLKSSARAMRSVSLACDGHMGVLGGLAQYRAETAIVLICAGLNKTSNKDVEEINELIFKSGGVPALIEPLRIYAETVMNGGKRPKEDSSEEAGEASGNPQPSA